MPLCPTASTITMPEFLLLALATGVGVTLATGPLGCFAVWRRMAYFGDTMAHSALLGVTLGLLLDINPGLAVAFGCLLVALALVALQQSRQLATDTLLGILSHATLALGLVAIAVLVPGQVNLMGYLFGDILATNWRDVITVWLVSLAVLAVLAVLWRKLIAITVHEDLARIDGIAVGAVRTTLMLLMAVVIAISMKIVGVLLITALLIIPAATARRLAHSPEQMALLASALGAASVALGLGASWYWDWPAGPAIVIAATGTFLLSLTKRQPQ